MRRGHCSCFVDRNGYLPSPGAPAKAVANPWAPRDSEIDGENFGAIWGIKLEDYPRNRRIQRLTARRFWQSAAQSLGAEAIARFFRGSPGLGEPWPICRKSLLHSLFMQKICNAGRREKQSAFGGHFREIDSFEASASCSAWWRCCAKITLEDQTEGGRGNGSDGTWLRGDWSAKRGV
ncbi:hypothetical protein [Lacticaseibacillus nasuensis]|uniref:hypothetical protein n=1 Tax=Lacticaseibacillus nasuensis TaxID=944671 RepID=UPI001F39565D|nr:hypothetical protein [Lacticaseibacillus nasuensis]